VIVTDHQAFNYAAMPGRFPLIVDTRNALKGIRAKNIFRL
jgi:UDP-N-acetyl-D-mannosaminuronate dehydrogenase